MGRSTKDRDYRRLSDRLGSSIARADTNPHRRRSASPSVRGCLVNRLLRIKGFNPRVDDRRVEDILLRVFEKYSVHHVTVYRDKDECVAYAHFRNRQDALDASRERHRICICNSEAVVLPMWGSKPTRRSGKSPRVDYLTKRYRGGDHRPPSPEKEPQPSVHRFNVQKDILPEDNPIATRTIYVGNLESNVTTETLGSVFSRFGIVQNVHVKRSFLNAYAFVRFGTVDMAYEAKKKMSNHHIGNERCTIGYAKPMQSKMVWVGGLDPSVTTIYLVEEFAKHGAIASVDYINGERDAFIQYKSTSSARAAVEKMRGFQHATRRWKTDFGTVHNYRSTMLGQSRPDEPKTLLQVVKKYTPELTSRLLVKHTHFPIRFYLIGGHEKALTILKNHGDLKMNKKFKLDLQKVQYVEKSINKTSRDTYGIFIGFSTVIPLDSIVAYLRAKMIAGIAIVIDAETGENYNLYIFPPSEYSKQVLMLANSYLAEEVIAEEHVVVVIARERS